MEHENEKGIVLLEAIVAIGVLVTIFTAVMSLYLSSIESTRITNDTLIATFLAQDAMEQIVAKKQYNYRNYKELSTPVNDPGGWLHGFGNCDGNNCSVDYLNNTLDTESVACGTACHLYTDGDSYSIDPAHGDQSYFDRWFTLDVVGDEARVTVVVEWREGSTPLRYELQYLIYRNPNINN